jgi:uncharacterized protein
VSPQPRHPGPFVDEFPSGDDIVGVETSTAAFIGAYNDPGGVPAGEVVECASLAEFQGAFGEAATEGAAANLSGAVAGFFANGGRRCFAVREDDAVAAAASALEKLAGIDDVALVAAPGIVDVAVLSAIAAHCSEHARFAIFDTPEEGPGVPPEPTAYGAVYFPWLEVECLPAGPGRTRFIPPSGHVAGVLARVDAGRGVHATPGGQPVAGAVGLRHAVGGAQASSLSAARVNSLRKIGDEVVVWGARTLSDDPEWKYVNVRRLFIFLEHSIERSTRWVVFEPNDEPLWARVRNTVGTFLLELWRAGALAGATPEEAFFVRCDRTTMTQDDLDSGRLIALIGAAPLRPAEFVIIRIGQWTRDADNR